MLKKDSGKEEESVSALEKTDVKMYTDEGKAVSVESAADTDDKKIDITV